MGAVSVMVLDVTKVPYSSWEILGFSQPLPLKLIQMRAFLYLVPHMFIAVGTGHGAARPCEEVVRNHSGHQLGVSDPPPLDSSILVFVWRPTICAELCL